MAGTVASLALVLAAVFGQPTGSLELPSLGVPTPKGRHAGATVGEAGGGSGAAGSRSARRVSDVRCGSEVRQGRRVVDRRLVFRC